jgi:hypothetical protein
MRGCIERITTTHISGWFVDDAYPQSRVDIRLFVNEELFGETRAQNYRRDLHSNAVGDGRYGFVIPTNGDARLPGLYLAGRVRLQALVLGQPPVDISPAPYLENSVRANALLQSARTTELEEFLDEVEALAKGACSFPDIVRRGLNSSRAHFPHWCQSARFLELARNASDPQGYPLSHAFYRTLLESGSPAIEHASSGFRVSAPTSYGNWRDLASPSMQISIQWIRPELFEQGSPASFLEEMGFFSGPTIPGARTIQVLAIRETAFGDSTWWVQRKGKASPVAKLLYYTDFEQLLGVIARGGVICLDVSNEGPACTDHWNKVVEDARSDLGIPRHQLLYVTQNLAFASGKVTPTFAGEVAYAHYFVHQGIQLLQREYDSMESISGHISRMLESRRDAPPDKLRRYLCMNFTPRWHRWIIVLFLFYRGYLSLGYVSFPGATGLKMNETADLLNLVPGIRMRDALLAQKDALLRLCPMTLDVESDARSVPEYQFPFEQMSKSLFQIVTESEVGCSDRRRITEKILKPIVGLQPFIVVGNRGSLSLLREMGFRTFDAVFDERYDEIVDPAARLDAVFGELDRLLELPLQLLIQQIETLNDIVMHNFIHLLKVAPLLFDAAVQARLRRTIATMVEAAPTPPMP